MARAILLPSFASGLVYRDADFLTPKLIGLTLKGLTDERSGQDYRLITEYLWNYIPQFAKRYGLTEAQAKQLAPKKLVLSVEASAPAEADEIVQRASAAVREVSRKLGDPNLLPTLEDAISAVVFGTEAEVEAQLRAAGLDDATLRFFAKIPRFDAGGLILPSHYEPAPGVEWKDDCPLTLQPTPSSPLPRTADLRLVDPARALYAAHSGGRRAIPPEEYEHRGGMPPPASPAITLGQLYDQLVAVLKLRENNPNFTYRDHFVLVKRMIGREAPELLVHVNALEPLAKEANLETVITKLEEYQRKHSLSLPVIRLLALAFLFPSEMPKKLARKPVKGAQPKQAKPQRSTASSRRRQPRLSMGQGLRVLYADFKDRPVMVSQMRKHLLELHPHAPPDAALTVLLKGLIALGLVTEQQIPHASGRRHAYQLHPELAAFPAERFQAFEARLSQTLPYSERTEALVLDMASLVPSLRDQAAAAARLVLAEFGLAPAAQAIGAFPEPHPDSSLPPGAHDIRGGWPMNALGRRVRAHQYDEHNGVGQPSTAAAPPSVTLNELYHQTTARLHLKKDDPNWTRDEQWSLVGRLLRHGAPVYHRRLLALKPSIKTADRETVIKTLEDYQRAHELPLAGIRLLALAVLPPSQLPRPWTKEQAQTKSHGSSLSIGRFLRMWVADFKGEPVTMRAISERIEALNIQVKSRTTVWSLLRSLIGLHLVRREGRQYRVQAGLAALSADRFEAFQARLRQMLPHNAQTGALVLDMADLVPSLRGSSARAAAAVLDEFGIVFEPSPPPAVGDAAFFEEGAKVDWAAWEPAQPDHGVLRKRDPAQTLLAHWDRRGQVYCMEGGGMPNAAADDANESRRLPPMVWIGGDVAEADQPGGAHLMPNGATAMAAAIIGTTARMKPEPIDAQTRAILRAIRNALKQA